MTAAALGQSIFPIIFITVPPGSPTLMDAPSSLTCDSNSNMAVTLQWTPPTNTGGQGVMITHYNITGLPQSASCSTGPCDMVDGTKGLSSREAARGHATNVDGEMLSVTINRIYNYDLSAS